MSGMTDLDLRLIRRDSASPLRCRRHGYTRVKDCPGCQIPPFDPRQEGSVDGVYPREAISLRVTEGHSGWWCASFSGDGSKPGSLRHGAGGFETAEAAFAYLLEHERRRTVYGRKHV